MGTKEEEGLKLKARKKRGKRDGITYRVSRQVLNRELSNITKLKKVE